MIAEANKVLVRRYYEEIGIQRALAAADELFGPDFRHFPIRLPVPRVSSSSSLG